MIKKTIMIVLLSLILISCGKIPSTDRNNKENNEVKKPLSLPENGIIDPSIGYEDDEYLSFQDHFGWFLYSKKEEKIKGAIDLKYYGADATQGDPAVTIIFDKENTKTYIYEPTKNVTYIYSIEDGTVTKENGNKIQEKEKLTNEEHGSTGRIISNSIQPEEIVYQDKNGKAYSLLKNYNPDAF